MHHVAGLTRHEEREQLHLRAVDVPAREVGVLRVAGRGVDLVVEAGILAVDVAEHVGVRAASGTAPSRRSAARPCVPPVDRDAAEQSRSTASVAARGDRVDVPAAVLGGEVRARVGDAHERDADLHVDDADRGVVSNVTVAPECGPPLVRARRPRSRALPRREASERAVELRVEVQRVGAGRVAELARRHRSGDLAVADDLARAPRSAPAALSATLNSTLAAGVVGNVKRARPVRVVTARSTPIAGVAERHRVPARRRVLRAGVEVRGRRLRAMPATGPTVGRIGTSP